MRSSADPERGVLARAARHEPTEYTPVWFMRQAGRILPEYRAMRERWTLIEICRQPELCAEVTLQPLRRMPVDGAVLFADIMLPLVGIGVELELVDDVGPVIASPIRDAAGVRALRHLEPEQDVPFVMETIRLLRGEIAPARAVIGFAGGPFTLASYLVEGRPSRDFAKTKAMMHSAPDLWHAMLDRLASIMTTYLLAQVHAGVDVVQLFDSWVGALDPDDYATFVQPYSRRIFADLAATGVPAIHFGTNTTALLDQMKTDGADIIGVDWRIPLDRAWRQVGHDLGIQGNLDPGALLGSAASMERKAADVLRRAGGRPGHIFNLGHGLHPATPLENAIRLVHVVHELSARATGDADAPVAHERATAGAPLP
ncbi:MAG: uroporphyrinogen decarboxylase [Gemmatimonadaceae bacterium]